MLLTWPVWICWNIVELFWWSSSDFSHLVQAAPSTMQLFCTAMTRFIYGCTFRLELNWLHTTIVTRLSLDWKRSSGWLESWEGLLLVNGISTTCVEAIYRVKTLKMASETSVNNNSPSLGSNHPDDLFLSFSIKVCYSWVQTIFLVTLSIGSNFRILPLWSASLVL